MGKASNIGQRSPSYWFSWSLSFNGNISQRTRWIFFVGALFMRKGASERFCPPPLPQGTFAFYATDVSSNIKLCWYLKVEKNFKQFLSKKETFSTWVYQVHEGLYYFSVANATRSYSPKGETYRREKVKVVINISSDNLQFNVYYF